MSEPFTYAERRRQHRRQQRAELAVSVQDRWSYLAAHGSTLCRRDAKTHPMECECGPCLSLALSHVLSWGTDLLLSDLNQIPVPEEGTPERIYLSRLIIKTCFARTDVRGARERLRKALDDWDHHQLVVPPPVVEPRRLRRIQPPVRVPS